MFTEFHSQFDLLHLCSFVLRLPLTFRQMSLNVCGSPAFPCVLVFLSELMSSYMMMLVCSKNVWHAKIHVHENEDIQC